MDPLITLRKAMYLRDYKSVRDILKEHKFSKVSNQGLLSLNIFLEAIYSELAYYEKNDPCKIISLPERSELIPSWIEKFAIFYCDLLKMEVLINQLDDDSKVNNAIQVSITSQVDKSDQVLKSDVSNPNINVPRSNLSTNSSQAPAHPYRRTLRICDQSFDIQQAILSFQVKWQDRIDKFQKGFMKHELVGRYFFLLARFYSLSTEYEVAINYFIKASREFILIQFDRLAGDCHQYISKAYSLLGYEYEANYHKLEAEKYMKGE